MNESANKGKNEIVVFDTISDSQCGECQDELGRGSLIILEKGQPLCLECADLDHLEYLPRGDAALTRRAGKHSRLSAVVVRWSRARKRYERQGLLVEEEALRRAEEECLADADARQRRRERESERRAEMDRDYVERFAARVRELYARCPAGEETAIAEHACLKYSGRVGRSAAAKEFELSAINLAVRAAIRHQHTRYDELLAEGWERREARAEVEEQRQRVEEAWRGRVATD